MSRHRNIRSKNFSEEYEGYDDVYGHSVEDDYCVSPSVEQFLYDRNKRQQMSAFLGPEEEIAEEDEDMETGNSPEHSKTDRKNLNLNDIDQARLQSCLEEVRNVIGDSVSEQTLIDAALSCDFNFEKVLNLVLNTTEKDNSGALKPTKADSRKDKDDCSSRNSSPSHSDSYKTQNLLTSSNVKESNLSSEIGTGGRNISSGGIDKPMKSTHLLVKTGLSEKSGSLVPDHAFTKTSESECQAGKELNASGFQVSKTGGSRGGPHSDFGASKAEMDSHSSDSEEDAFSSLCSLVIHNRKRLSESDTTEQNSPSGVPSVPSPSKVHGSYSTPSKPVGFIRSLGQIDSESEDDDFSSLQSLVVHNRSGSDTSKNPSNPIPSFSLSALSKQMENSEIPTLPKKGTERPNKSSDDSDSEDFNFSSLCSLVIRNRSHADDDGARASDKASDSFSSIPEKVERTCSPVSSGKAVPSNIPSLSVKNVERSNIPPKLPAFSNRPSGDSGSETEEEDFSSLCSLVIHNRNNPSVPGAKIATSPSAGSPLCGSLEKEFSSSPGLNKFIIPPLMFQKSSLKGTEKEVAKSDSYTPENLGKADKTITVNEFTTTSTDGSNQSSEDEDYIIDLCSTVKAIEIPEESSFEDVDELHLSEEVPSELVMDCNFFLLPLNEHDEGKAKRGVKSFERVSPFGQTLCRKWDCLVRKDSPRSVEDDAGTSTIEAFVFQTESPDDVCRRLRSTKYLVKVESPNVAA